jgi:glycosyltransferase involved in cell wall biosynthesis
MKNANETPPKNLICFSHLRWDFVFQRPQHLLSRFAQDMMVYFFEEPVFDANGYDYLEISERSERLRVVRPHLEKGKENSKLNTPILTSLLGKLFKDSSLEDWVFWYYTPMALQFSEKFKPKLIIYDCMDELSAFKFAPAELPALEKRLIEKADLVFTGGHSLYEAKKDQHTNIFPFPSSIDKAHFGKARKQNLEPQDQARLSGPKIGFFGVIDERFDLNLIRGIAEERPDWQLILIGPVLKIDPATLPKNENIHYLGQKSYGELPDYLCGWDVALIPFLLNDSTRYISPTKTPEYLAAGIPVVSTPIRDVIKPYGIRKLVSIAADAKHFTQAINGELNRIDRKAWLKQVDVFLMNISWDDTYLQMQKQINLTLNNLRTISIAS